MKHFITFMMALMLACTVHAQKDVTTFLGIPVDGFKTQMKNKLIAKGFTPTKMTGQDFLDGQFNGYDVRLFICTNNNKVYRIMLVDAICQDEARIKIRYNNLVNQFKNNKRYMCFKDYEIPETEDISSQMLLYKKKYDACFYQKKEKNDSTALLNYVRGELLKDYTEEQLDNLPEELEKEIKDKAISITFEMIAKKSVWFTIFEYLNKYYIAMYYDNGYNKANGEDL